MNAECEKVLHLMQLVVLCVYMRIGGFSLWLVTEESENYAFNKTKNISNQRYSSKLLLAGEFGEEIHVCVENHIKVKSGEVSVH